MSVDLEVNPKTAKVFDLAAVAYGDGPAVVAPKSGLEAGLTKLEKSLTNCPFIVGHNVLRHDIEHLLVSRREQRAKMDAPIDTLWLNPLAFRRIYIIALSNIVTM